MHLCSSASHGRALRKRPERDLSYAAKGGGVAVQT